MKNNLYTAQELICSPTPNEEVATTVKYKLQEKFMEFVYGEAQTAIQTALKSFAKLFESSVTAFFFNIFLQNERCEYAHSFCEINVSSFKQHFPTTEYSSLVEQLNALQQGKSSLSTNPLTDGYIQRALQQFGEITADKLEDVAIKAPTLILQSYSKAQFHIYNNIDQLVIQPFAQQKCFELNGNMTA